MIDILVALLGGAIALGAVVLVFVAFLTMGD